MKTSKTKEHKG